MKVFFKLLSCWFSINLLLFAACGTAHDRPKEKLQIEQVKPLSEPQTDSLKNYLDEERARRKAQGKE